MMWSLASERYKVMCRRVDVKHDTKVYFVGCGKEVGESDDVRVRHARFGHSRPVQLIRVPVLARVLSHHERGFWRMRAYR